MIIYILLFVKRVYLSVEKLNPFGFIYQECLIFKECITTFLLLEYIAIVLSIIVALLSYGVTATIGVIISRLTLDWARKSEFNILIAFLHISGLLIYLELKIKNSFLKIIKKLMTLQCYLDIFS